ncbi:hypothetical protein B0H13DRAFT_2654907 [Mycena leptocephala]|nr:hypothetical protein B0H13DRAFT_2654907 [Mycena leptocephala]
MSASAAKDYFTAIWLHPVPAHLSTHEFALRMVARADTLLALPVAQNNLLKYEIMVPNDLLDSYFQALGVAQPQPVVLVKVQCETKEHYVQFLRDAQVAQLISGTEEFAGASMFSVHEATRVDPGTALGSGAWIGIFKCPPHLSGAELYQVLGDLADGLAALPIMQRNLVKHTMHMQNDALEMNAKVLGLPTVGPVVVAIVQSNFDTMNQVFTDSDVKRLFAQLDPAFTGKLSNRFAADIITKFHKA